MDTIRLSVYMMLYYYVKLFVKIFTWNDGCKGDPSGRAVQCAGTKPLACWDYGCESCRGHGCPAFPECYVLSGRGLCDGPITRPEESYRLWCVWVWRQASTMRGASRAIKRKKNRCITVIKFRLIQLVAYRCRRKTFTPENCTVDSEIESNRLRALHFTFGVSKRNASFLLLLSQDIIMETLCPTKRRLWDEPRPAGLPVSKSTFSIRSMQACRSMPKSMKVHSIPSLLYSSCSSTNMWWLKNCWSFSLVKLIHSCSKPLNCAKFA